MRLRVPYTLVLCGAVACASLKVQRPATGWTVPTPVTVQVNAGADIQPRSVVARLDGADVSHQFTITNGLRGLSASLPMASGQHTLEVSAGLWNGPRRSRPASWRRSPRPSTSRSPQTARPGRVTCSDEVVLGHPGDRTDARAVLRAAWLGYAGPMRTLLFALPAALLAAACGSAGGGTGQPEPPAPGGGQVCGSVRLTSYAASAKGWCEFHRTLPILPASVRSGMTLAIAQPWDGGSYGGAAGEACGECWEIDSISGTQIVMVHDLCPVEGNPLCAGGHFHFDLSTEAATALQTQGLYAASTRRVACPVAGNAHLEIIDRNEWGYLRFQVVNHRVPVRLVEYRPAGGGAWKPAQRNGGAWHITDDGGQAFGSGAAGGVFRLTSAQGQVLETASVLGYGVAIGSTFDLGAQLTDREPATGPACVFEPPADVYVDGYGGIDQVSWQMNPWGNASASQTTSGCVAGSCIRVSLAPWDGFHIYYVQPFPTSTFATLSLKVRATSGSGTVNVSASREGTTCSETSVTPTRDWATVTIDLASTCAALASVDAVTVSATSGSGMALLLDDVRFQK